MTQAIPMVAPSSPKDLSRLRWTAFCLFGYLLFSMIGLDPFAKAVITAQTAEGSSANQIVGIGLALILLIGTWRHDDLAANLALPFSMALLLAYCLLTVGWSIVPGIALRRWVLTAITMWLLFRAVAELGYGRTLFVLRWTMAVLLAINYFAVMFLNGVHQFEIGLTSTEVGAWRGILIHKNVAGSATALTLILFLFDRRSLSLPVRNAMLFAGLVFLFFTQSKASMSGLALAVGAGWSIRRFRFSRRSHMALYAVLLVLVLVPVAAGYYGNLVEEVNDPHGFTGRSSIWAVLLAYVQDHFWTGAGFDSFWQVGSASPVWKLTSGWVAELAAGGHNGYLDLLVTIGFPGLVLALVILFVLPVQRLLIADGIATEQRSLLFALIAFCAGNNLAESQLLDRNQIDQMFLVLAIALIGRITQPVRHRSPHALAQAALARLGLGARY